MRVTSGYLHKVQHNRLVTINLRHFHQTGVPKRGSSEALSVRDLEIPFYLESDIPVERCKQKG